ncbi:flagellar hook protein FlgE [Bacillus sp. JJ634]
MLRSMYSGISGLKNMQTKLDVIGNNVANVNTYGFKKGRVTFSDTMNQTISGASAATANKGGTNAKQVGLGSTVATIDTIHTQSSLQTTGRDLDLAISGDGYFVVKNGDAEFYTRAGNFYLDDEGTLVNGEGLKVQAYKIVNDKVTNTYGDVAVNVNAVLPAKKTDTITFSENLSSDSTVDSVYTQQIKVTGADGTAQAVTVEFKKTGANTWELSLNDQNIGTLDFSSTPADIKVNMGANGDFVANTNGSIVLNFSNLTQNPGTSTALVNPNGSTEGKLDSFNISSAGEINGVYSNGQIVTLGQLAVAKFSNASGLMKTGGTTFQESINSGTPNINVAGNGRGSIAAGSLEMSNVDLSEEFTEMIVAQRGFQSNTRIITTSDEILQELVNLKR